MKRFSRIVFVWFFLLGLIGCGGGTKEAKELLSRLLQVVGIPYEMVVNICQDSNGNGFCDKMEIHTKITINKWDTADKILAKIKLDENGTYLLEHYDPTKKILMELEDTKFGTDENVTLSYEPKDPKKVKVQELSILQALIDNGLLAEEEVIPLKKSKKARELVDSILLENLFYNQELLEENNLSKPIATLFNLEYIAEGLKDINISGDFVPTVESCENNNSCITLIEQDVDEQTEINATEAKIIAENNSTEGTGDRSTVLTQEEEEDNNSTTTSSSSTTSDDEDSNSTTGSQDNNSTESSDDESSDDSSTTTEKHAADGYIIKLSSPAKICCSTGEEYYSDLSVGAKGLITFENVYADSDCKVRIPKGSIIDSNNNGQLDGSDKNLSFDMYGPADVDFISPLSTILLAKISNGEDVSKFKEMVRNFDPVTAATQSINSSGVTKERLQKLMTLMEVAKIALDDDYSVEFINISSIIDDSITFKDFNIKDISVDMSGELKNEIDAKAQTMKDIVLLLGVIDTKIIDINTFIISISDGGLSLMDAFKSAILPSVSDKKRQAIMSASSIDHLISDIVKSSYSSTSVSKLINYFSSIDDNINNMLSGYYSIQFINIDISNLEEESNTGTGTGTVGSSTRTP